MKIKNIVITDLSLIALVLVGGAIIGVKDCLFILKYDGIGAIVASIGILWLVGAIVKFNMGQWMGALVAAIFGTPLVIWGVITHVYGMSPACITVGIILILFNATACNNFENFNIPLTPTKLGLALIIMGVILIPFSKPTENPKDYNRTVDIQTAWQIHIYYYERGSTMWQQWDFEGTEVEAIKYAELMKEAWRNNYPENPIIKCQLICIKIPDWYKRKYGWPLNPKFDNI